MVPRESKEAEYNSELELQNELCRILQSVQKPGGFQLTTEFNYARGKTDVVALDQDDNIFAFETKLTRWRDALQQAYRNTCYAHCSMVVVPENVAQHASMYSEEFRIRSVGLCYLLDGKIVVVLPAPHQHPILPWLSDDAISRIGAVDRE